MYFDEIKVIQEKGVVDVGFTYDALGMRIGKSVDGTATVEYVNAGSEQVIFVEDLIGSNDIYYLYGTDLVSQGGAASTSREYFLTDGMGNVRYLTDDSGSVIASFDYDPYGNMIEGSTDDANLLFQSENFDADVGLTYLRARYYDPTTGRFISRDPISGFLDSPVSQNGYNYANNDPINLTDPTGMAAEHEHWGSLPGTAISANRGVYWQYADGVHAALNHPIMAARSFSDVSLAQQVGIGVSLAAQIIGEGGMLILSAGGSAGAKAFSPGTLRHFKKILAKDGPKALLKSKATLERRLQEHLVDLQRYAKEGGFTSSVEKEIKNFKQSINAINHLLGR